MQFLPLTGKYGQGKVAIVDDADYDYLSQFRWNLSDRGYVRRCVGSGKWLPIHRELTQVPKDLEVDHINHDKLDNRRENLRVCTHAENVRNLVRRGSSGFRGVQRVTTKTPTWYAHVSLNGKRHHLGSFATPHEAAAAYNRAVLELHGEFALLNDL